MRVSYETIGRDGRGHLEGGRVSHGRDPGRVPGEGGNGKDGVSLVALGHAGHRLEDGRLQQGFFGHFGQAASLLSTGTCHLAERGLKSEERGKG